MAVLAYAHAFSRGVGRWGSKGLDKPPFLTRTLAIVSLTLNEPYF